MDTTATGVTRRDILACGASFAALSTLPAGAETATSGPIDIDFSDPVEELRAHVKLVGSLQQEKVVSFLRLNIYADAGEGSYIPLFTLNNLLIDYWEPQGDNEYQMTKYEAGYYTEIDSYEPIESFVNPLTEERRAVENFRLGPFRGAIHPSVSMSWPTITPHPLQVIGDRGLSGHGIHRNPPCTGRGGQNHLCKLVHDLLGTAAGHAGPVNRFRTGARPAAEQE